MISFNDKERDEGFKIFKNGLIRRLSQTHFIAKSQSADAWQLVELSNGHWKCDCSAGGESCIHLYAALLQRSTTKLQSETDQTSLKCRYCASPDIRGCGFRYNARGIVKRYHCLDCGKKFSIPYVSRSTDHLELGWLLNEIGMLTSKLTELLSDLNDHMEFIENSTSNAATRTPDLESENRKS
jgi:RNase P subunit RPR2